MSLQSPNAYYNLVILGRPRQPISLLLNPIEKYNSDFFLANLRLYSQNITRPAPICFTYLALIHRRRSLPQLNT